MIQTVLDEVDEVLTNLTVERDRETRGLVGDELDQDGVLERDDGSLGLAEGRAPRVDLVEQRLQATSPFDEGAKAARTVAVLLFDVRPDVERLMIGLVDGDGGTNGVADGLHTVLDHRLEIVLDHATGRIEPVVFERTPSAS